MSTFETIAVGIFSYKCNYSLPPPAAPLILHLLSQHLAQLVISEQPRGHTASQARHAPTAAIDPVQQFNLRCLAK